ncbi:hypothetical protein Hs30E_12320 [Lactococcus hodotermopsidis]|uniref:Uncharacterized protein n=1 Tax=Pseudolactococcus hodotermopsidis TaxID=2709157 RepID=A0A6A0BEA5_9LACT|nr:glycoside hydrolase family 2 TIM barrel-domain containing protein [Lactococcus hodotermopsidis]GFH42681.1 hypothetical protein Hs30E_12320 [Lactococcus hodotermopsidis]
MKERLNNDWQFIEQPLGENFSFQKVLDLAEQFEKISIPHDWLIKDVKHLYRDSEGWYKRQLWVETAEELTNQQHFLQFDGVYMDCEIYLNQVKIFEWKNGYTGFEIAITEHLQVGKNELVIRVRNQTPNTRWYSGAGIYRHVWYRKTVLTYLVSNGVYVNLAQKSETDWLVTIETMIRNTQKKVCVGTLSHVLSYQDKQVEKVSQQLTIPPNELFVHTEKFWVRAPQLWSTERPQLYQLVTTFETGYTSSHNLENLGFRKIDLTTNKGLFLNGKSMKIQGVCLHHDLGLLGSAVNQVALKRQLNLLKEMGVNAIRTAHNPATPELLALADELGFLVQSELTDVWRHPKTTYDYARFFDDWVARDVESWIKRERNHPSVFMWSIGNEISDTHNRDDGEATLKRLVTYVKQFDPYQNAVITFGTNYLLWEKTQKAAAILKIVGYNYGETLYQEHHEKYPDWVIYGSETASVVQSRGIYHFPLAQSMLADDDFQCSALGNSRTSWGAKSIEDCLIFERDCSFSLGQFIWSGFDYIGEPTPYHSKTAYLGQIDTAGFPKDAYYIFQAAWTDYRKAPMIHLFPYWDFSENQLIDLRVCSNAPEIELFFNGESLGRRQLDKLIENWHLPYQTGQLLAKAYDEFGHVVAEDSVQSFSDAKTISTQLDKTILLANGEDIAFLEISMRDDKGTFVANANNWVQVEVSGAGVLIGLDNGDSTDFTEYKGNVKPLFSGKLLAMIGSTTQSGEIQVCVKSPTLETVTLSLTSETLKTLTYRAKQEPIRQLVLPEILPVRKIALTTNLSSTQIKTSEKEILITATLFPKQATYQALDWRVTDVKGIDSSLAEIKVLDDKTVKLTPLADGDIFIRCGTKNGAAQIQNYALLPLTILGFKEALLNAYQQITGGLYTRSNLPLSNGNARGVATSRGEESWVVFDKVDFGTFGSDELTLSLFPLEDNPFEIEIWQGYPHEPESACVATVIYTQGTQWNTYQDQQFSLPKRLKGVQTISFVFRQKVHLGSFVFEKQAKAFTSLLANEADEIYGDSFEIRKDVIEHIGNNVVLEFSEMAFGDVGATAIQIIGRANQVTTSIQLKISDEKETRKIFLDFPESHDYSCVEFALERIIGNHQITFIFLPGADFNFKSFQFKK